MAWLVVVAPAVLVVATIVAARVLGRVERDIERLHSSVEHLAATVEADPGPR